VPGRGTGLHGRRLRIWGSGLHPADEVSDLAFVEFSLGRHLLDALRVPDGVNQ
jgi:hypothetical protein